MYPVLITISDARRRLCILLGVLALVGCAASGQGSSSAHQGQDHDLITVEDLEGMDALNAYEAIRRLRPVWLRYRGQSVITGPDRESLRVYVDQRYYGNAEVLSTLMARNIREIRFLDSREATLRFGTDHTVGAILITTGR